MDGLPFTQLPPNVNTCNLLFMLSIQFLFRLNISLVKEYSDGMPNVIVNLPLPPHFSKIIAVSGKKKTTVGLQVIFGQNKASKCLKGSRRTVYHRSFNVHKWRSCGKNSSFNGSFVWHKTLMHRTVWRPATAKRFVSNVLAGTKTREVKLLKAMHWILHY